MALLADGLHMGSHAVALGIAAFAYAYARKNAGSARFSFGTGKVNALGGFTGAILLAVFALYMVIESVGRFIQPVPISFDGAIFVSIIGLVVNGVYWSSYDGKVDKQLAKNAALAQARGDTASTADSAPIPAAKST